MKGKEVYASGGGSSEDPHVTSGGRMLLDLPVRGRGVTHHIPLVIILWNTSRLRLNVNSPSSPALLHHYEQLENERNCN